MSVGAIPAQSVALMTVQHYIAADSTSRVHDVSPPGKRLQVHTLPQDPAQKYILYLPRRGGAGAPVFVTVHGVSRNARKHARLFASFAERYGVVLVAPLFTRKRFPHYQRLKSRHSIACAPCMLDQIVADVERVTSARTEKLYLFGYSGGGQFVHRYAMAYPERVAGIVVGAAGWYTFPDSTVPYPLGIRPNTNALGLGFQPYQFLKIPACVLVGERDLKRDSQLKRSRRLDLHQGATRLERGKRWIKAMITAAQSYRLSTRYCFNVLPQCGHSFTDCMTHGDMGQRVFEFLFPDALKSFDPHDSD